MSELLLTSATPNLRNGRGVRTYGVTAALARHGPVEVVHIVFEGERAGPEYEALAGVSLRPIHATRGAARALEYVRARLRGVPSDVARGASPELAHGADGASPDVRVIADGPTVAAALLPLTRRRAVVYLAHNLESGFRELGHGNLARFERKVLRAFAECWMPTHEDVRSAIELGGDEVRARYVPNVVDTGAIEPVSPRGTERLLFVGDFTYEPNREGFGFLTAEVLPRLWERRPALRLAVAGRGLTAAPGDARVEVLGFVDELRSAYASADAVAVPLLHGGGSPLKFVEALAYGLPVVATRHAARLLEDAVAGEQFLVAADAVEFAELIDGLLDDPARAAAIGAAGRELAARSYSVDALARLLAV
jgi:glycosyltransferase involved in cell wall biosynthesis